MDYARILKKIGLTDGESRVYLALLSLGESTTGPIIKESKVSSSKVYDILDRLTKDGLVSVVIKQGKKTFKAADPSRLVEFLDAKEIELKEQRYLLKENLQNLVNMQKYAAQKQEAEILEGIRGIKTFNELVLNQLKEGDTFYILGAPIESIELMGAYFVDWHNRRLRKKVRCKIIYDKEAKQYGEERKKLEYTEVRYLPEEIVTPAIIDIAKDYVATILFGEKPLCVVIKNKKIAESYLVYFELLWKIAKK